MEAERRPGRPTLDWARAAEFGLLVAWANWAAAAVEPRRPLGWTVASVTAAAVLFAWQAGVSVPVLCLTAALAAAGWLIFTLTLMGVGEAVAARYLADRVWIVRTRHGRACGRVSMKNGAWSLNSVAAWPFGRGVGTQLRDRICQTADAQGAVIRLTADTARLAETYYRAAGFATIGRNWLHQPEMQRNAAS